MSRLRTLLHNHLPFIIIMPLLIIVMTWPTFAYVVDTSTVAFPSRNYDVWQKMWDVWHGRQFLAGQTSFYHSDAMFYPVGISLAFENFSLPHMLSVGLLEMILPTSNAYTLTYLLIVFAVALSGYFYLNYLFRDRWLALLGAAVFGLSQHVLAHAAHPDVNLIVSLPLTAYFFQRGLRETRIGYLFYCGLTVGLTAFLSLYIFVCVLITLALFILCYAFGRWKDARYWRWMLLLGIVIALASAGRILPMLADAEELAAAFEKNQTQEIGTDLLSYFVNYWHPILTPPLRSLFGAGSPFYEPHTSYLGYLPLALIIIGLLRSGSRRKMLPWLALALPFLLLRMGSVLQVDGEQFSQIVLPKSLLAELLPAIFGPFHATDHFQMGVLLPLAVMSGYGLKSILASRPANLRALFTLIAVAVIALEYYESTAMREMPAEQFAFINWLRQDSAEREPRLINLPMGRQPSKLYGFYQLLTAFPQVEGLTGRTPPAAYAYIRGNYLLGSWEKGKGVHCFPPRQSTFVAALDQLRNDGFTHIIWHHWPGKDAAIASGFNDAQSAYSDDFVSVYRLEDLHQSCDLPNSLSPSVLQPLRNLQSTPGIIPQQGTAILSILSDGEPDHSDNRNDAAILFGPHIYASLALDADGVVAQPSQNEAFEVDDLLADISVILLAYDPLFSDAIVIGAYRGWLATRFKSCRRLADADDAVVEIFLDAAFPCELAVSVRPLAVDYVNGIQLGNLLVDSFEQDLDLHLLWKSLPEVTHAYSIQFIDEDGARAAGEDFVLRQDPLAHHRIDTSSLPAGHYRVIMILYDYDSGASLSGIETASGSSLDRMFEITTWTVE
ncbi:MAG: hypothetical protein OXG53_17935 [Chloroflexi bacterium]|nr:hypothetical protein [Chloroflexota bacterium]